MKLKRHTLAILAATMIGGPQAAAAQDAPETTPPQVVPTPVKAQAPSTDAAARVSFLLSGYEFFPTREDLDKVGDAATITAILASLVEDKDARPSLRTRAVDALGLYDDDVTATLLAHLATTPVGDLPRRELRTATLIQHHAITSLARSRRAQSVVVLEALLTSDDTQIRLSAINAIGKFGGKDGQRVLGEFAPRTKTPVEKRELAKWVR